MSRPPTVPLQLRHAPFRGSDAVARGLLTRRQLDGPAWRRLYRDVYINAATEIGSLIRCAAAALLPPPDGVLSHLSAAFIYGADVLPANWPVEATVPPGSPTRSRSDLLIRRASLPAADRGLLGSLPVTAPLRTGFDIARGPDLVRAVVALDALLHRRLFGLDELRVYGGDGHVDWPGIRRVDRVLALAEPAAESPMETRLRLVLVLAGLPRPVAQHAVHDGAGRFIARLDLA